MRLEGYLASRRRLQSHGPHGPHRSHEPNEAEGARGPRGSRRSRRFHRPARAFTLIELLIALTAGAIVTAGAFAFARVATRSFQQETRIANAMYANTMAFRRMVSDVQRAGFLSTPNIQRDYQVNRLVCLDPSTSTLPTALQQLTGLRVERGVNTVNGVATDRLTIAGSFSNNEPFPVRSVSVGATGIRVLLQPNSGAMQRALSQSVQYDPTLVVSSVAATTWAKLFPVGRLLRIVDQSGFQHFGAISASGVVGTGTTASPYIDLAATPAVYLQGAPPAGVARNPTCTGIAGLGVGVLANVVNRYVYELASLKTFTESGSNPYATIFSPTSASSSNIPDSSALPGEDTRVELVRYELALDGTRIAGTTELVAEYGVDLSIRGADVDTATIPGTALTKLTRDTNGSVLDQYLGAPLLGALSINSYNSERVRSLQLRLVVRTREGDRTVGMTVPASSTEIARVALPNTTVFSRARTLQAEVTLPNHAGVLW